MDPDCLKTEIHYSDEEFDTKYNPVEYQPSINVPKTENAFEYSLESPKVECPASIKRECDLPKMPIKVEQFPELEESLDGSSDSPQLHIQLDNLSTEGQIVCLSVFHNLMKINNLGQAEAVEKASQLCGISKTIMLNLVVKGVETVEENPKQRDSPPGMSKKLISKLTTEDIETIKKTVRNFYMKNENPSVRQLYLKVRESNLNLRLAEKTFRSLLKEIGFKFERINKKYVLFENGEPVKRNL